LAEGPAAAANLVAFGKVTPTLSNCVAGEGAVVRLSGRRGAVTSVVQIGNKLGAPSLLAAFAPIASAPVS
jgi:hypothetical protein